MQYPIEKEKKVLTMFIDYDKNKKACFNNLYLKDYKYVLKMPIMVEQENKDNDGNIIIEKFNLGKRVYLLSYD